MSSELSKYEVFLSSECIICEKEFLFMRGDFINEHLGKIKHHMNWHKKQGDLK